MIAGVTTPAVIDMNARTILFLILLMSLFGNAHAAKCKFEVQEANHVESKRLVLFRGATIGLMGYFGVKDGERYIRGLFGSNFKARAMFTADTPLELIMVDNRTVTLNVVTETISSKLKFGHIITGTRDAHPVYSVTPEQWSALQAEPIASLRLNYDVKGERRTEARDVKKKHAQRIMDAIACVSGEGDDN